ILLERIVNGLLVSFFFQAEDGIRDFHVTGVQTCALPIYGQPEEENEKRDQQRRSREHDSQDGKNLLAILLNEATYTQPKCNELSAQESEQEKTNENGGDGFLIHSPGCRHFQDPGNYDQQEDENPCDYACNKRRDPYP